MKTRLVVVGLAALAAFTLNAGPAQASTQTTCSTTTSRGQGCVTWIYSWNSAGSRVVRPGTCSFTTHYSDLQDVYHENYGADGHGAEKSVDVTHYVSAGKVTWDCGATFPSWAYASPGAWLEMQVTGYPGGHTGQENFWIWSP